MNPRGYGGSEGDWQLAI